MAARGDFVETKDRELNCPRCNRTATQRLVAGWDGYVCPRCRTSFTALAARVRSNRSKGDRLDDSRAYSVRLMYGGEEDLYEFEGLYREFDMSAGDEVAFLVRKEVTCLVYNFTLGRFMRLHTDRHWMGNRFVRLAMLIVIGGGLAALLRH